MIVTASADGVSVFDATDLTRLHIETGLDRARADGALRAAGFGRIDETGEAMLQTDVLRQHALDQIPPDDVPGWETSWGRMLQYASSQGWTREEGDVVVAHVEPTRT